MVRRFDEEFLLDGNPSCVHQAQLLVCTCREGDGAIQCEKREFRKFLLLEHRGRACRGHDFNGRVIGRGCSSIGGKRVVDQVGLARQQLEGGIGNPGATLVLDGCEDIQIKVLAIGCQGRHIVGFPGQIRCRVEEREITLAGSWRNQVLQQGGRGAKVGWNLGEGQVTRHPGPDPFRGCHHHLWIRRLDIGTGLFGDPLQGLRVRPHPRVQQRHRRQRPSLIRLPSSPLIRTGRPRLASTRVAGLSRLNS